VARVAPGKFIVFFQTGRIRAVVPDLVACQPHGIQHFDVLGDCDLAEIKRSFGKDICVIGNVSPVVLARGSVEEARAEARRCLDAAKADGAYIMSTSDEVPVDAKIENMKAMVEVGAAEGRY
jgi:uroporphyrinogen decarboxylase